MKKINRVISCFFLSLIVFAISACVKDETHFYPDPDAPGLAIFSDKADNVMSCYVDGQPWRTIDRTTEGFLSPAEYEVNIRRWVTVSATDTLVITWEAGILAPEIDEISLALPIPKNFSAADFNRLQGQRMVIDSTNGCFFAGNFVANGSAGRGDIYFHFAELDTLSVNLYEGRMSGLFDADFGTIKVTNGRFDHSLEAGQVLF